ncbi:hypothetical protein [Candidatus Synchoanobacter obligatus]|uniref:Uncharacterized protein n=1 Tax=Candidatus Synchoanobacter obligatus TaxID=2919597 RepID=A0ABT1L5G4_9GAMM|nr:hypothetical protein [Candidatus Synchoanobacter obligatus]MCP8352176.1 hypothetical protein [Candidatus Synchoanobacter obligatus]
MLFDFKRAANSSLQSEFNKLLQLFFAIKKEASASLSLTFGAGYLAPAETQLLRRIAFALTNTAKGVKNTLLFLLYKGCFLPIKLALSLVISTLDVCYIVLEAGLGIVANLLYVLLNNLFIHIGVLQLGTALATTILAAPPAIIDHCARQQFKIGLAGIKRAGISLLQYLKMLVFALPSLLTGQKYMLLDTRKMVDQQSLTSKEHSNEQWIIGIDSYVISAFKATMKRTYPRFNSLLANIVELTLSPLLVTIKVAQMAVFCLLSLEYIVLSAPITLSQLFRQPVPPKTTTPDLSVYAPAACDPEPKQ